MSYNRTHIYVSIDALAKRRQLIILIKVGALSGNLTHRIVSEYNY